MNRVAALSKSYLTVTGIIITNLMHALQSQILFRVCKLFIDNCINVGVVVVKEFLDVRRLGIVDEHAEMLKKIEVINSWMLHQIFMKSDKVMLAAG